MIGGLRIRGRPVVGVRTLFSGAFWPNVGARLVVAIGAQHGAMAWLLGPLASWGPLGRLAHGPLAGQPHRFRDA
eukprot:10393309-Alexandrium_andersonii.AAC.1